MSGNGKSACGLCTVLLALAVTGRVYENLHPPPPAEWANLRTYALETYPGADCENVRAAKVILSPSEWVGVAV